MTPTEVKSIRQRFGLTQSELAGILRLEARDTIRKWETGARPVTGPASIILEMIAAGELPPRFWPT